MATTHQDTQSNARINASAERAWQRLRDLNLPASPEHYALFFAYYNGHEQALIKALDEAITSYGNGSESKLAHAIMELHDKFLGSGTQQSLINKTAGKFEDEMKQILEAIEASRLGADNYGIALNNFSEKLLPEASAEQIRYMVTQMALETRATVEQNQKLQEQLVSSSSQVSSLRTNLEAVRKESLSDPLTGIGNRKAFTADLTRITEEAARRGEALSLLMIDIDHFKKFNDSHGHLVGDQVLKLVAHTLKENIKGRDTAARWGGEEFGILLPQTKLEDAVRVGDHLRKLVASKKIIRKPQNQDLGAITLSIGATQYIFGEEVTAMVDRADQALYRAKQEGRNRVIAAAQPTDDIVVESRLAPASDEALITTVE